MTALVIASQPHLGLIHVGCDAAIYSSDTDQMVGFGNKVLTVPHWPGAVTNTGNKGITPLFGNCLAQMFPTFDDAIERAEMYLPQMAAHYNLPTGGDVILAGVSESRGPEAWFFTLDLNLPPAASQAEMDANSIYGAPLKLQKLPNPIMTPIANDHSIAADYEQSDFDGSEALAIWNIGKVLTMQRHTKLPEGVGGIGGFASVTTISADGIRQRIIKRWSMDWPGEPIIPGPIDWKQWHRANPRPRTTACSR